MSFSEAQLKTVKARYLRILSDPGFALVIHDLKSLDRLRGSFYMIRNTETELAEFYIDEVKIQTNKAIPSDEIRLMVDGMTVKGWEI